LSLLSFCSDFFFGFHRFVENYFMFWFLLCFCVCSRSLMSFSVKSLPLSFHFVCCFVMKVSLSIIFVIFRTYCLWKLSIIEFCVCHQYNWMLFCIFLSKNHFCSVWSFIFFVSLYLSNSLFVFISICLSLFLNISLSVYISVCIYIYLSICL
jgi:hypothetical protein